MTSPDLFEEAKEFRFSDPVIEQAYRDARRESDLSRARRVVAVLTVLLVGIGGLVGIMSAIRGRHVPPLWLFFRFGMLAPSMLAIFGLTWTKWGQRNLGMMLSVGMAIAIGAFSLEWALEWQPGMPIRGLWLIPLLTLFGCAMALPMGMKAVTTMTVGVFVITAAGIAVLGPGLDGFSAVIALVVFGASGYGIHLFSKWREIDAREGFLNRREKLLLAEEIRRRNEELVQMNKLRDQFVEGVLHDIRSPLTAILMSSSMLRDATSLSPGEMKELVDGIERSGRHIDSFVTRFLDQRSLDRADVPPTISDVPLDAAIENLVARARLAANLKGQRIVLNAVVRSVSVRTDELLLDRALGNLLDNAIKYSPRGSTITLRVAPDPAAPIRLRMSVTDQGPGVTEKEMEMLFQPYGRLRKKTTGGEHSIGLGLSLVKKWIEAMGGAVGCESDPGGGAMFWISLPRS